MRVDELQRKILKAIRTTLSHRDLCNLCSFNDLSSSGLKRIIQDRLEHFIHNQSYNRLLQIHNKIEEYDRSSAASSKRNSGTQNVNALQTPQNNIVIDAGTSNFKVETLSDSLIKSAPIDLFDEVAVINRNEIVVVSFTTYTHPQTVVPTEAATGINERVHNIRIPNMLSNVQVNTSPFYCCAVCLHPLSLLIPQQMPNINASTRITSKHIFQFSLSENAQKLIAKNLKTNGNKIDYKWQVLLRFISIDPTEAIPTPGQSVSQMIPPYLSLTVNNESVGLWDILPSNCKSKEGKRHPKPINITDKLNISNHTKNFYRQTMQVNWWQTPSVFQYYYVGVYLERKLSVKEILDLFIHNKHVNILPIEATLSLIKTKLCSNDGDTDDLVVSSVLPISLSCPVGRSRIEIPLRTLNCQHLQCFDAHIYLSMNDRRSIWKCPICDISATPNELFCDKYFQKILHEFKDNENVNDINVSSDGSYHQIFRGNDDKTQPETNKVQEISSNDIDAMIVLDSDDENDEPETAKNKSLPTQKVSSKFSTSKWHKEQSLVQTPSLQPPKTADVSKSVPNKLNQTNIISDKSSENSNLSRLDKNQSQISAPTTIPSTANSIQNQLNVTNSTSSKPSENLNAVQIPRIQSVIATVNKSTVSSDSNTIPVSPTFMSSQPSLIGATPNINPSMFSNPPPLYPSYTLYTPQNIPVIQAPNASQYLEQHHIPISTPISAHGYAPNFSSSSTVNQKMYQINSLIKSSSSAINVPVTQAPIQTPTLPLFTEVIQAPTHLPFMPTLNMSATSSICDPIPAPINVSMSTLLNTSVNNTIQHITQSLSQAPVTAPILEQIKSTGIPSKSTLAKKSTGPVKFTIQATGKTSREQISIEKPTITAVKTFSIFSKDTLDAPVKTITSNVVSSAENHLLTSGAVRAPVPAPQFESLVKQTLPSSAYQEKPKDVLSSTQNILSLKKNHVIVDRTINDVVKTLKTNVVCPIEPPIKNLIARPISCPVILLDSTPNTSSEVICTPLKKLITEKDNVQGHLNSEGSHQESVANITGSSQNLAIDNRITSTFAKSPCLKEVIQTPVLSLPDISKKISTAAPVIDEKSNVSKKPTPNAAAHIPIPSVSIDLTSDDEEEVPPPKPAPVTTQPQRIPMTGGNIKWCNLMDPKSLSSLMNTNNLPQHTRSPSSTEGRTLLRQNVNINSFSHFKPGAINRQLPKRTASVSQNKPPIDLTGDDEDEAVSKRSRVDNGSNIASPDITTNRLVNQHEVYSGSFKN